jgi:hypothetical protein
MVDVVPNPANQMVSSGSALSSAWTSPQSSVESKPIVAVPWTFFPIFNKLSELVNLPANWDSYGGRPVTVKAAVAALRLLVDLQWPGPLPSVAPTAPGGVQFEWGGDDEGVEVSIGPDGTLTVLMDVAGQMHEAEVESLTAPLMSEALAWAARLV